MGIKENIKNKTKKNTFNIPAKIKRWAKLLQFFSPNTAANYALKLFLSPQRYSTPERERMMQESAKNELFLVPEINKEVMVYTYGYSKTKVLLAHGWAGRGTQLFELADKLLENGMMVISFDAPAHGMSKGKTTNLNEMAKTIHFLNTTFGPFEAAIGHSFGGIALFTAQAEKPFLNKLVSIGIDSSIANIIDEFIEKLGLKPKVSSLVQQKLAKNIHYNIDEVSAAASAKKLSIPTLILHDIKDKDVDVSSAFKIRQNLSKGELLVTKGLGHRQIFRDQKVIQKIIAFIKS